MRYKYDTAEVQSALDAAAGDIQNIIKKLHLDFPGVLFSAWVTGEDDVIHAFGNSPRGRVVQVDSRRFKLEKRIGDDEAIFAMRRKSKPLANPQ